MPSKKWREGRKRKANLITTKENYSPFFFEVQIICGHWFLKKKTIQKVSGS